MGQTPHSQIVVFIFIVFLRCLNILRGNPDTPFVYSICSKENYPQDTPYLNSVGYILDMIVWLTSSEGCDYYPETPKSDLSHYYCEGHGACNGALEHEDCYPCLSSTKQRIIDACRLAIRAQIQLEDCRIRYDNHNFVE